MVDNNSNINNTYNTVNYWNNIHIKLLVYSIVVGGLSGIAVVFYRYLLERASELSDGIYIFLKENVVFIPLWILFLAFLGYIVGQIIRWQPLARGSGIPQVEGELIRKLNMNWYKVLIAKFIGCILSIFAGLSLGRQGPSVQIGATIGKGFCRIFKRINVEEKFLITSGASAGLSASFNAPLSGVIFSLEQLHKNFSSIVLVSAMSACITADVITLHFFGQKPLFDFSGLGILPLNKYITLIILGIIVGLMGTLFNRCTFIMSDIYESIKCIPINFRPIIPFVLAGALGILFPQVLRGGHDLIQSMVFFHLNVKLLISLIVIKFFFTLICSSSGSPGGTFMPVLVLGALTGSIYGHFLVNNFGFEPQYVRNLVIFAMAGYFTAIAKAPITGSVLITEMTGSFSHLLPVIIVCISAYIVSDLLETKPLYEALLSQILKKHDEGFQGNSKTKVIIETAVCLGSKLEGNKVRDLDLPHHCLLICIKRGDIEIIPRGDTEILPRDYLVILANEDQASNIREYFNGIAEKHEIQL